MGDALTVVESIYFTFQDNLDEVLAACPDQATRDAVLTKYVAARQNYWQCINRVFHDDDPAVRDLVVQAKAACADLETIDAHLGDIAKVIDIVTKAVTIGSQIAAKVITL
jgi:hypothetical protein